MTLLDRTAKRPNPHDFRLIKRDSNSFSSELWINGDLTEEESAHVAGSPKLSLCAASVWVSAAAVSRTRDPSPRLRPLACCCRSVSITHWHTFTAPAGASCELSPHTRSPDDPSKHKTSHWHFNSLSTPEAAIYAPENLMRNICRYRA